MNVEHRIKEILFPEWKAMQNDIDSLQIYMEGLLTAFRSILLAEIDEPVDYWEMLQDLEFLYSTTIEME